MTPHELNTWLEPQFEREKAEDRAKYMQAIYTAWNTVAFSRQRRIKPLKGIMERFMPKKKSTPKQMLQIVEGLNKAFGGKDLRAKA